MLSVLLFTLINLPYGMDELKPVITDTTLNFHYGKHLKGYVDNLNKLISETKYEKMSLEEIVKNAEGAIFNNAGQIFNHNLYFTQFRQPKENNKPAGQLLKAIERDFNSFDAFKETFTQQGVSLLGSGWVWLSADKNGNLFISQEKNANNPITQDRTPLLTMDVWEHAYYLDYQNNRAKHLTALWTIINWEEISKRYEIGLNK